MKNKTNMCFELDNVSGVIYCFDNQNTKCRVVLSTHEYSEGYWLEFPPYKKLAKGYDFIIKEK